MKSSSPVWFCSSSGHGSAHIVKADVEMEVRAGHEAGVAQRADEVAARHAVAHRNQDVPQMRVAAAPVGVVLDANDVRPMRVGDMRHHRPVGDGDDRIAAQPTVVDVEPVVHRRPARRAGVEGLRDDEVGHRVRVPARTDRYGPGSGCRTSWGEPSVSASQLGWDAAISVGIRRPSAAVKCY